VLGKIIKKKRKALLISSIGLGELIEVSGTYILLIEKGRLPTEEILKKIIVALKFNSKETEEIYSLYDDEKLSDRVKEKISKLENKTR
jgi:predicted transcriptional regulator